MNASTTSARDAGADRLYRRRRIRNAIALLMSCVAAIFGLLFLAWILWTLVS